MQEIIIIASVILHSFSPGETVGFTDLDWQPPRYTGRRVWVTPSGGYSFFWTYRYDGSNANRRAYYNYHLPPSYWLGATAMDMDQSRMVAPEQMSDGRAFGTAVANVTVGYICRIYIDAAEGAGTFTPYNLPPVGNPNVAAIGPKPCIDDSDFIYIVVSTTDYSWWSMSTDQGNTWAPWDSSLAGIELNATNFLSLNECWAHSVITPRISLVNNMSDYYFTIVYWETENQGSTWYYDTIYCSGSAVGDSVRGFFSHSACYDNSDYLHVVFTCIDTASGGGGASFSGWRSQIRHWSQQTGEISVIDNGMGWVSSNLGPGPFHPTVSEPQIAIDPLTGNLYCTWCFGDPADTAANGWVNLDIWGAKSTDNGATWIEQHNITNSPSPGADSGHCDNDHMNHLAEETLNDTLVIFYMNDKDAGFGTAPPSVTMNPMLFYLYKWNPPGIKESDARISERFNLDVMPNPVFRNATITYALHYPTNVSLKLYSIDGRLVRIIHDGYENAGIHAHHLDCAGLANGIYFITLKTATTNESRSFTIIH